MKHLSSERTADEEKFLEKVKGGFEHHRVTVDYVNHPPHYTVGAARCSDCNKPIECIDVSRHYNFNIGNAIKYIWRCDLKANAIEDLEKAIWYLKDEIAQRKKSTPIDKNPDKT